MAVGVYPRQGLRIGDLVPLKDEVAAFLIYEHGWTTVLRVGRIDAYII
jgi:hypothetical protein